MSHSVVVIVDNDDDDDMSGAGADVDIGIGIGACVVKNSGDGGKGFRLMFGNVDVDMNEIKKK